MNKNAIRYLFKTGLTSLIGAAALFLTAGRLDWWPAWLYIGLSLNNQCFVFFYLRKKNPGPLKERSQRHKGAKKRNIFLFPKQTGNSLDEIKNRASFFYL